MLGSYPGRIRAIGTGEHDSEVGGGSRSVKTTNVKKRHGDVGMILYQRQY